MKKNSAKILVVDDDSEIVEILNYNLSNSGFEVKVAYNGAQAVKKSKKFRPDIISVSYIHLRAHETEENLG